ncbi:MAG: serine/threonine-protein phosphatase [Eubacteriales bacterium]|nr:serine/threonine-protein phosphatase [Eubacteriales bacterium]
MIAETDEEAAEEQTVATFSTTEPSPTIAHIEPPQPQPGPNVLLIVCLVLAALAAAAAGALYWRKRRGAGKSAMQTERFTDVTETIMDEDQGDTPCTETVPMEAEPLRAPGFSYSIGAAQTIGGRENQEDSFYGSDFRSQDTLRNHGLLAIMADGVGGMKGGENASASAIKAMAERFIKQDAHRAMSDRMLELVADAQQAVLNLNKAQDGNCGTTVVSALMYDDQLVFASVGDSRIYLYRAGVLLQLNREHVLGKENDEKLALQKAGEQLEARRAKAITAYIGKQNLRLIDRTLHPMKLVRGDRILLMSDGVFGTLSEEEMLSALHQDCAQAANTLIKAVVAHKAPHQDNATVVIVGVD